MAETLGMLCDKLTIVKLKQFHTDDVDRLNSLDYQSKQLQQEINDYISDAINGIIPLSKITFNSNKVYKKEGNELSEIKGNIGELFYQLADINCILWHEVEKGYDVDKIPSEEKGILIKRLAVLNLNRNQCIDLIDIAFKEMLSE